MRCTKGYAAAFAAILVVTGAVARAATTPSPGRPPTVVIHGPNYPLHTEVVVEVNKKGQVVRVKSTKPSKLQTFNLATYGNALQMWIRHPDGTAEVGLYRVTYDYDPKTQKITRSQSIISRGGSWANDPGAANVMVEMARKQYEAAEAAARKAQPEQNTKLPSLNEIRGFSPSPSPRSATLPPI